VPEVIARIASFALALVFAWAAIAKIARPRAWSTALGGYDIPQPTARVAAVAAPVAELAVAAAIVAGWTRTGAALALFLLASFSGAIVRAQARRGDRLPCGCFGGSRSRDYRWLLVRNAMLAVTAAVILLAGRDVRVVDDIGLPSGAAILPAVLVAVGCALVAWIVATGVPNLRDKGSR
jgi:methylamine utilization protein MauE